MALLVEILDKYTDFFKIVESIGTVGKLDLSPTSSVWMPEATYSSSDLSRIINQEYIRQGVGTLWGGYLERREMYQRSEVFTQGEVRSIHLGIDIWQPARSPIFLPLDGTLHSEANNAGYGNYGPTMLVQHSLDGKEFYTLYGHLSLDSLGVFKPGDPIKAGTKLAVLGTDEENGNWPAHLHFQVIENLEGNCGDYPGVAPPSKKSWYQANCPDPNLILGY